MHLKNKNFQKETGDTGNHNKSLSPRDKGNLKQMWYGNALPNLLIERIPIIRERNGIGINTW